ERCAYDGGGQLVSGSFMDYAVARADDLPPFVTECDESQPCTHNPLGAKGCGEAGLVRPPAAGGRPVRRAPPPPPHPHPPPRPPRPRHAADQRAAVAEDSAVAARGGINLGRGLINAQP